MRFVLASRRMSFWQRWLREPQRLWVRRALFQVHLWTGLVAGLYVFAIGLTGSVLVFRPEIYRRFWQTPTVEAVSPLLTEAQLEAAARRVYPGYRVTRVIGDGTSGRAVEIWLDHAGRRQRARWFDPYTGDDLGEAVPAIIKVVEWTLDFHDNLLGGETGRTVNGIGGLALVVMCLTGAVIWWPGARRWRRGLTIQYGGNWRRFNWSLHGAVGFWCFVLLFMWAFTGAYLVFQHPFMALVDYLEPLDLDSLEPRVGDMVLAWLARVHFGRFYGVTVKILWVGLGLAMPVLFVTGALMWWNRVLRPKGYGIVASDG